MQNSRVRLKYPLLLYPLFPVILKVSRITSYNVCYTKLLRTSDDFVHDQVLPTITKKTVNFINENANGEKPFFIYVPFSAPHTPILPTDEFKGKSGLDNIYVITSYSIHYTKLYEIGVNVGFPGSI